MSKFKATNRFPVIIDDVAMHDSGCVAVFLIASKRNYAEFVQHKGCLAMLDVGNSMTWEQVIERMDQNKAL